jgi:hypothetical protein
VAPFWFAITFYEPESPQFLATFGPGQANLRELRSGQRGSGH